MTLLVWFGLTAALPVLKPLDPPLVVYSSELISDDSQARDGDSLMVFGGQACPGRAASAMRALGGALSLLERLQRWFSDNPDAERRLFGRKGVLAELLTTTSESSVVASRSCTPPKLAEGWKWAFGMAPKLCPAASPSNQTWFVRSQKVAAAVVVTAAADVCSPRLSTALFDPKGRVRVLLNVDFSSVPSVTLMGASCKLELVFDSESKRFIGQWKSCPS
jgi:hypothetical protein